MGPRIRHHRFSDTARSQAALGGCPQPVSRSAHAVSGRALRRAVALVFALGCCVLAYWWIRMRGRLTLEQRAMWLHGASRRVLRALGIESRVCGTAPARGLVVSNHLSYLDIALIST